MSENRYVKWIGLVDELPEDLDKEYKKQFEVKENGI
jgi:hypothetical protein